MAWLLDNRREQNIRCKKRKMTKKNLWGDIEEMLGKVGKTNLQSKRTPHVEQVSFYRGSRIANVTGPGIKEEGMLAGVEEQPSLPLGSRMAVGVQLPWKRRNRGCARGLEQCIKGNFCSVFLGVVDILPIVEVASLKLCSLNRDGARPCCATT